MPAIKYVNLFTKEGRLLKEILRSKLPTPQPDFLVYGGNFFQRIMGYTSYTEVDVYLYEEQALPREAKPNKSDLPDDIGVSRLDT